MRSLAAGLVPDIGLQHLAVGRLQETRAIQSDLRLIAEGGSSFRILSGIIGSGKTFLETITRTLASESNLVVIHVELNSDHRLHGGEGRARKLLAEMMSKVFTRGSTQPGALRRILETWMTSVTRGENGMPDPTECARMISENVRPLRQFQFGPEYADVLEKYYQGFVADQPDLQDHCLRWLQGKFSTKTEARQAFGVRTIIDDNDLFNALKIFSLFCQLAGYAGLLVIVDELSVLTERLPNAKAREATFHTLLNWINQLLQGGAQGLGIMFAGTTDAVEDPERGLFSYAPLRERLRHRASSNASTALNPVIPLQPLSPEEIYQLLHNIVHIDALGLPTNYILPDEGIRNFMERQPANRIKSGVTRSIVCDFIQLLGAIDQDAATPWPDHIEKLFPPAGTRVAP
jgi:hypothetical protein